MYIKHFLHKQPIITGNSSPELTVCRLIFSKLLDFGDGGQIQRRHYWQDSGLAIHRSWVPVLAGHHWPWVSYLHLCASVTKQYNLVLAKESGGSLWLRK